MRIKALVFLLLFALPILTTAQSCYEGLLNVAIKEYNSGKYEDAIKNLNSAKKICSEVNTQELNEWISKANKKIAERSNRDTDGDGVSDKNDKCPSEYANTNNGCPPKLFTGFKKATYSDGSYEGNFINGKFDGMGTYFWNDRSYYEGQWRYGKMHGLGTYVWPDGNKYVGDFNDGKKQGPGTYTWYGEKEYSGNWREDEIQGQGTMTILPLAKIDIDHCKECKKYVGEFKDGLKDGYGKCFNSKNEIIYEGEFRNDKPTSEYPYAKYKATMMNIDNRAANSSSKNEFEQIENQIFEQTAIRMKFIKGGTFNMGSSDSADQLFMPLHQVTVDDFYIGVYEISQQQWVNIMGKNPTKKYNRCNNCAVSDISWNDAQEFIKKLNTKTGKKFRFPTEAQWEYAARGGEGFKWAGSNNVFDVANLDYGDKKIGTKKPNGYGLYDMSGSVSEWCSDYFSASFYKQSPQLNPENKVRDPWMAGSRVTRGGDGHSPDGVTVFMRSSSPQDKRYPWNGLRLALDN